MKYLILLVLLCSSFTVSAQYNKEKLVNILTNGNIKSWSAKGTNVDLPEKSYAFNINGTMQVNKADGKGKIQSISDKWSIDTKDNIRWFLRLGNREQELIISYDKSGNQYIKLTHQTVGNNTSVYYETILNPLK